MVSLCLAFLEAVTLHAWVLLADLAHLEGLSKVSPSWQEEERLLLTRSVHLESPRFKEPGHVPYGFLEVVQGL